MTRQIAHHGDTDVAENEHDTRLQATVAVKREGMSFLQWVAVVGLGTVLMGWLVPQMWKQLVLMQQQMIEATREQSAALVKAADSMEEVADNVGELTDQQQDLLQSLDPLVVQLKRLNNELKEEPEPEP